MKINVNRGMYLESVINNSIEYYENNMIAIFRKQVIPIKIKQITHNEVVGRLIDKCDVDYYGIVDGKYIAIEAKQTKEAYFEITNILEHQIKFLDNILKLKGIALLIIYFQIHNNFYLIKYDNLKKYMSKTKYRKRMKEKWFIDNGIKLDLIFPGRLNFVEEIKKLKTK